MAFPLHNTVIIPFHMADFNAIRMDFGGSMQKQTLPHRRNVCLFMKRNEQIRNFVLVPITITGTSIFRSFLIMICLPYPICVMSFCSLFRIRFSSLEI